MNTSVFKIWSLCLSQNVSWSEQDSVHPWVGNLSYVCLGEVFTPSYGFVHREGEMRHWVPKDLFLHQGEKTRWMSSGPNLVVLLRSLCTETLQTERSLSALYLWRLTGAWVLGAPGCDGGRKELLTLNHWLLLSVPCQKETNKWSWVRELKTCIQVGNVWFSTSEFSRLGILNFSSECVHVYGWIRQTRAGGGGRGGALREVVV